MEGKLKLSALDADDLGVISAAVQESLVAVRDCAYFAGEKRFVLLLNRFRWEADATIETAYWRTHSALVFNEVDAVHHHKIRSTSPTGCSNLLSVALENDRSVILALPPAAPYGWKSAGSRAIWGTSGALAHPMEARPSGRLVFCIDR